MVFPNIKPPDFSPPTRPVLAKPTKLSALSYTLFHSLSLSLSRDLRKEADRLEFLGFYFGICSSLSSSSISGDCYDSLSKVLP